MDSGATDLHSCDYCYQYCTYCTVLDWTAPYCTVYINHLSLCSDLLCTSLHCTTLHCTTLRCTALLCAVLKLKEEEKVLLWLIMPLWISFLETFQPPICAPSYSLNDPHPVVAPYQLIYSWFLAPVSWLLTPGFYLLALNSWILVLNWPVPVGAILPTAL